MCVGGWVAGAMLCVCDAKADLASLCSCVGAIEDFLKRTRPITGHTTHPGKDTTGTVKVINHRIFTNHIALPSSLISRWLL